MTDIYDQPPFITHGEINMNHENQTLGKRFSGLLGNIGKIASKKPKSSTFKKVASNMTSACVNNPRMCAGLPLLGILSTNDTLQSLFQNPTLLLILLISVVIFLLFLKMYF